VILTRNAIAFNSRKKRKLMNLFYDISVLGGAVGNNSARTGVFRVVENVALQLSTNSEISLNFTAINKLDECLKYIEAHHVFNKIPLSHTALSLYLEGAKNTLSRQMQTSGFPAKQALKIVRGLLSGSHKAITKLNGEGNTKRINCDIFHSPYLPLPKNVQSKCNFITVYDLIPILQPQFFQNQENHLVHRVVKSIDEDAWVFCISEATKNDLLTYNPKTDPQKIAVIPLGASELFFQCNDEATLQATRKKYGIPEQPYFLSLSTLEPRKNIDSTVRSFVKLVRQEHLNDVNLVLVGTKGWDFGKILDEISASADLREKIIVTGYVDDLDLAGIYSGALAFVYPSFYEGFGLPPLEAMQCGVPVVTSNTSSLPEVVGGAGMLVDPTDNDALCQAMNMLYKDSDLRKRLSALSMQRATMFSWDACAAGTISHYRKAYSSK
jgi:glycosyltransferase involved in cell wall biosynthesis